MWVLQQCDRYVNLRVRSTRKDDVVRMFYLQSWVNDVSEIAGGSI
jgi:hypothetical protein